MGVLVAAALVCLVLGVGFAGNHSTAAPALGLTRITQGTLTGATGPVALTEEQQREVVELLNHTKKSSYTPCEDPGRPEGTVSLSNQDGSVEYRLLFQGDGPAPAGPGPQHRRDAHLPQRRLLLF